MSTQTILFACSKCFTRHPFEELSAGQQLCKECRGSYPVVKCTYCRSEFQQISKSATTTICRRCEVNIKQYGKPTACGCCGVIAAFVGNKCQRCTHSEAKYGPAVTCEQCKQRSAFDRDDKKIEGKLLCWLCTMSYKRVLAKARQSEADRRAGKRRNHDGSMSSQQQQQIKENSNGGGGMKVNKSTSGSAGGGRGNGTAGTGGGGNGDTISGKHHHLLLPDFPPPEKIARTANIIDPNSSDHVVAMTQLQTTIASLQKKLSMKDKELLEKDKQITELKAKNFTAENELRIKMKDNDRLHETKVDILNKKIAGLIKEVASLSKGNKRGGGGGGNNNASNAVSSLTNSGGSGTDSPGIN